MNFAAHTTRFFVHTGDAVSKEAFLPPAPELNCSNFMTRAQLMMTDQNLGKLGFARWGFDVTDNIELRMTGPKFERMQLANSESSEIEQAVARLLLLSFRDEAIWQYQVRRIRGFLFWSVDQSISYISLHDGWRIVASEMGDLSTRLRELLAVYRPESEAVVWSEHVDANELFRISQDGLRADCLVRTAAPAISIC